MIEDLDELYKCCCLMCKIVTSNNFKITKFKYNVEHVEPYIYYCSILYHDIMVDRYTVFDKVIQSRIKAYKGFLGIGQIYKSFLHAFKIMSGRADRLYRKFNNDEFEHMASKINYSKTIIFEDSIKKSSSYEELVLNLNMFGIDCEL